MGTDSSREISHSDCSSATDEAFNVAPSWEVIKSFRLCIRDKVSATTVPAKTVMPNASSNEELVQTLDPISLADDDDNLLAELVSKQRKLREAEMKLEPKLRFLLDKVVKERAEHESEEGKTKRDYVINTHKAYADALIRKREAAEKLQAQIEADMDAVCCICRDGDITKDNQVSIIHIMRKILRVVNVLQS